MTSTVLIRLPVCMFAELTLWHWITNWRALHCKGHCPRSQLSPVTYSSLCKAEASKAVLHPVWPIHWRRPYSGHIWETFSQPL